MRPHGLFLPDGTFHSIVSEVIPQVISSREGEPVRVEVVLTNSDMVNDLRIQLADQEAEITELKERVRSAEYGYMCQMELNNRIHTENEELWDLVEANGLRNRPPGRRKKKKGRTS